MNRELRISLINIYIYIDMYVFSVFFSFPSFFYLIEFRAKFEKQFVMIVSESLGTIKCFKIKNLSERI